MWIKAITDLREVNADKWRLFSWRANRYHVESLFRASTHDYPASIDEASR